MKGKTRIEKGIGEWKQVVKVWGMERWLNNDKLYCMKELRLLKGWMCSLHYHKLKTETFYIVGGSVKMEVALKGYGSVIDTFIMDPGDHIKILPGKLHRFSGLEESIIMECSTKHFDSDSYREIESGKMESDNGKS